MLSTKMYIIYECSSKVNILYDITHFVFWKYIKYSMRHEPEKEKKNTMQLEVIIKVFNYRQGSKQYAKLDGNSFSK